MSEAWVTLATNDGYAQGALVLAHSLKASGTIKKLHCMVTNYVSDRLRAELEAQFDEVSHVDVMDSNDHENLALINRPDLGVTFTKLNCWRLVQYNKAVFLDADTMVLQNSDELFERPEFSAAPDIGWPDCFNSGVFVYVPSLETYRRLLDFALSHGSFDGGDQGLLNEFFAGWRDLPAIHRLPFIYNMTAGVFYSYAAAYKKYGASTKIVHFIGADKPWHGSSSAAQSEHLEKWKQIHQTSVAAHTTSSYSSPIGPSSSLPSSPREDAVISVQYYSLESSADHIGTSPQQAFDNEHCRKLPPMSEQPSYESITQNLGLSLVFEPEVCVAVESHAFLAHPQFLSEDEDTRCSADEEVASLSVSCATFLSMHLFQHMPLFHIALVFGTRFAFSAVQHDLNHIKSF
ncbi:Glycogenin-1, variant 2 [Parelaphostrongylus tenuis]|uniref:glycogenin glucosyltransferase n=1 Tax=Parelaphostrongylus tenuis TaxID=148309 RepID=A0AAD5QCN5_PARTN|nr:Glycogenin-1, variant 2 [Parelaphostrongylus tenuis]